MRFSYDEYGRHTGSIYGNTRISYSYNIRGWMTKITSRPFVSELHYTSPDGFGRSRYNGSLSGMRWWNGNGGRGYAFSYDGHNRFLGALGLREGNGVWVEDGESYTERAIRYDSDGNLLGLKRTASGRVVDDLEYFYGGGRLQALQENIRTALPGDVYAGGKSLKCGYVYDSNGNMIKDMRRGLELSYNCLNLLTEVRRGGVVCARYIRLSDGTKTGVRDGGGLNGMDYRGSLIYVKTASGSRLSEVHFGEGMFSVSPDGRVDVRWFVKDHLGSVRAVTDGQGNVLERNDYYPFGARHLRSNQAQSVNRYKYNGKEEQRPGGLGYLDYGARMYDAALGRWFSIDPLSEGSISITPYGYCGNNPLVRIDPDGRSFDRYQSDYGSVRWFRSSRERLFFHSEWWTRLGAEYSLELGDGRFFNFYQNVPVSLTDSRASALLGILNNDGFKGFLLSNASPLDEEYRHDIVRRSIHHAQNEFLAHPLVRGTFDVLTFVGMGGVESLFSLSSSLCGFAGKHFGRTAIKTTLRAAKRSRELFNFSTRAAEHMAEKGRAVPIQILEQTIKGSKGVIDPRGSRALMHTTKMWKNGKAYNLEVLYDEATNSIWHFKYSPVKP